MSLWHSSSLCLHVLAHKHKDRKTWRGRKAGVKIQMAHGTFDLLVTYSTLLLPLVNWQLDQGLFRFMLDYRGNKEEQGKLFSTLLLSSTIQSIIYIILFVCVEPFLKIQNAYFLLLYVVLHVYTALFLQFVRGLGYSVKYTIASFISASATTVLNVIALAILKMGLQGLFLSTLMECCCINTLRKLNI